MLSANHHNILTLTLLLIDECQSIDVSELIRKKKHFKERSIVLATINARELLHQKDGTLISIYPNSQI